MSPALLSEWLAIPQMRDDLPDDVAETLGTEFQRVSETLNNVAAKSFGHFAAALNAEVIL